MGVLQKPCSRSERTGGTCVFGNLRIIFICYHVCTLYAKTPCDHNEKALPTLKKCQLCSVLMQLTPSKERSEMPTPRPEKKELSASQQLPTAQWRRDTSANGDFIKNRPQDATDLH